jgi:general secretion pathway protein J
LKPSKPSTVSSSRFILDRKGFTLLELIISITLIGIIVMILTGAMRLSYRSVASADRKIESLERIRSSFTIVDSQIQSYIPLKYIDEASNTRYYFTGQREYIQFSTNYSIWGGQKGYVIATYKVSVDNAGKEFLSAYENVIGTSLNRETRLFTGFDRIYFEYFYKEPAEEEGQWTDRLPDDILEQVVPEKVRISLVDGYKTLSLIIPVRVTESDSMPSSSQPASRADRI